MTKQTVRNFAKPPELLHYCNLGSRIAVHKARNVEIFMPVKWDQQVEATLPNGLKIIGRLDAITAYINSGFKEALK